MLRGENGRSFLTYDRALRIPDKVEREFALRCIQAGCFLLYQVPVRGSVIDFFVINPKRVQAGLESGTLVELTRLKKCTIDKEQILARGNNRKFRKNTNPTGARKCRQEAAMIASGYRWTILYGETIARMFRGEPDF